MSKRVLILIAVVALMIAACQPIHPETAAGAAPQAGTSLVGTQWVLTSLGGEPALAGVTATAMFDAEGRVSGNTGCNNYSSTYTVDGSSLTINPQVVSTLMACPDPAMNQEASFFQALANVAAYMIDGETLTLTDANGAELMVFAAQSQGLGGTNWTVTGFNNGKEAVVSPMLDTEITLSFGSDGTVSGKSGCNNYTGTFTTDGDTITIGPLASTMMMCVPDEVMMQESQFLAALESSATYTMRGTLFETRTADDAAAVQAIPVQ